MSDKEKDLVTTGKNQLNPNLAPNRPKRGFEDEQDGDIILPRAKVLQPTSQELVDERFADMNLKMGQLVNSLTKEVLNPNFIPIFKFNSNVLWVPKNQGGGMACRSLDGLIGLVTDADRRGPFDPTTNKYDIESNTINGDTRSCTTCKFAQWEGDKPPVCMSSMNFFVMFEDTVFPLVLPFKSTSKKFGKKLYSMAKMRPGDMFGYVYAIKTVRRQNEKGVFFETDIFPAGIATPEQFAMAENLYNQFKGQAVIFHEDVEESETSRANNFQNSVTDEM